MQLWTRRYTPGAGFAAPLRAAEANDIESIAFPSVTLDETGVATVACGEPESKGQVSGLHRPPGSDRRRLAERRWRWRRTTRQRTTTPNNSVARAPMPLVRNDAAGNVTVIWRKRTGTRFDLYGRRFSGGAWGTPTLLETRDAQSVFWPALGVGANGTAVAAWYYASEFDIWANVYR